MIPGIRHRALEVYYYYYSSSIPSSAQLGLILCLPYSVSE